MKGETVEGGKGRKDSGAIIKRTVDRTWCEVAACVAVLCIWEIVAVLVGGQSPNMQKVFPTLQTIFTEGVSGLARYCNLDLGGASPAVEGVVALVVNGAITLMRVIVGYAVAVVLGIYCALHLSQYKMMKLAVTVPVGIVRVMPAFAMAPLFVLWIGAETPTAIVFIVFSVFFIVFVAELEAIEAIDPGIVEYARTLGAPQPFVLYRIILPASLKGMRGSLSFAGLVAWTSVLSAELNGLQDGLGYIISDNIRFSNISEMFLAAVLFCILSFLTMKILERAMDRLTAWRK